MTTTRIPRRHSCGYLPGSPGCQVTCGSRSLAPPAHVTPSEVNLAPPPVTTDRRSHPGYAPRGYEECPRCGWAAGSTGCQMDCGGQL